MAFSVEGLTRTAKTDGTVRHIGRYEQLVDAIAAAKQTIDVFLLRECTAGMTSRVLFSVYQNLGEFPFIFRDDERTMNVSEFNHVQYAMIRCDEICAGK
jgi:hypothetical protein